MSFSIFREVSRSTVCLVANKFNLIMIIILIMIIFLIITIIFERMKLNGSVCNSEERTRSRLTAKRYNQRDNDGDGGT